MGDSGYSLFNLYLSPLYLKAPQDPMFAAGLKQIEYRMSNKEFRMMKLITSIGSFGVRYSLFVILRFAFELLHNWREVTA